MVDAEPHIDTEEQAAIRAKRGFICNFTGGHCPSGCASPCTYQRVDALTGEVTKRRDYNPAPWRPIWSF